jgi:hypothetical protein
MVPGLRERGVRHWRIELLDEPAEAIRKIIGVSNRLLARTTAPDAAGPLPPARRGTGRPLVRVRRHR